MQLRLCKYWELLPELRQTKPQNALDMQLRLCKYRKLLPELRSKEARIKIDSFFMTGLKRPVFF